MIKFCRHCRQNLKNEALDLGINLRLIFMGIFYLHQKRYKVIPKTVFKHEEREKEWDLEM